MAAAHPHKWTFAGTAVIRPRWLFRLAIAMVAAVTINQLGRLQDMAYAPASTLDPLVAWLPFEPFHTCSKKGQSSNSSRPLYVSCLSTIIVNHDNAISRIPTKPDLLPRVCQELVSANQDEAVFTLCLQTPHRLGVLVRHGRHDDLSFLASSEAMAVVSALNWQQTSRIIQRKTVAMAGYYPPVTPENDQTRSKDDNAGNFLWQYAATRMLNPATTHIIADHSLVKDYDPELAQQSPRALPTAYVIATANCLNLEKEGIHDGLLGAFRNRIQTFKVPVAVLGMGMQARFEQIKDPSTLQLFPFQKAVLQEIQRWQTNPAIGVRGELTRTLCSNSGIQHCLSTGCPTLMISRDPDLGKTLQQNWKRVEYKLKRKMRIRVAMATPAILPASRETVEAQELRMLLDVLVGAHEKHDAVFNLQAPYDRMHLKNYVTHDAPNLTRPIVWKKYNNSEEWLDDTTKVDLVLSTRIHGAMVGISSGIPTVVIPTDHRIQELIDAMMLPFLTMGDVADMKKKTDLASILKRARNKDFDKFEKNRREKILQWRQILEGAGLEMDPSLLSIIAS